MAEVIPRAGHILSVCVGDGVDPEAPTPGQGPWTRGRESPNALEGWKLMGVVDEARNARGGKVPLAPWSQRAKMGSRALKEEKGI